MIATQSPPTFLLIVYFSVPPAVPYKPVPNGEPVYSVHLNCPAVDDTVGELIAPYWRVKQEDWLQP